MLFLINFIRSPLFKYVLAILAVAAVLYSAYFKGRYDVQVKWDLANKETERIIAELETRQGEKTVEIVTEYVDRIKIVKEKGETIVTYVDRWITPEDNANCSLPPAFIVLHNAAVSGTVPKPAGATNAGTGSENAEPPK